MTLNSSAEMQKSFKLPLLPGNTCGEEMLRRNFRKTQVLSGNKEKTNPSAGNGIPTDFDSTLLSNNNSVKGGTMNGTNSTIGGQSTTSQTVSLNRKVLRFFGYYCESVPESALEKNRTRKIIVQYFLEDDTMSVSEPRQDNSGISTQGTMVKRHQVPQQSGSGNITYQDLAVGEVLKFYGREFFLVDCDAFTREFMASMGVDMMPAQLYPDDSYSENRKKKSTVKQESMSTTLNASGMKVKLSQSEIRATKQFLKNDRKVLRFGAMWDDGKALYGRKHFFTLYYFLSEDAIEVVEKNENNSGRDPFPSFCRRSKLVKPRDAKAKYEHGGTDLTFSAKGGAEYYTDKDLTIGSKVVVFGRELLIHSYDKFTQDYFRETYGITAYNPIEVAEPKPAPVKRIPPPYNGFGDEVDSLASWKSLDIKPPRKDESKWVKYGDNVVKFALKLDNGVATDSIRKFVLSCFMSDDTISIFEPVQRNSGIVGGKFLQRSKITNKSTGKPYVAPDFFVGQKVNINGYPFIVHATDERSLSYMEENSSTFALSNVNRIANKLQAMLESSTSGLVEAFHDADVAGNGQLDYKELCAMMAGLHLDITEQEILTLLRFFDRNGDAMISYEEFTARLLTEGMVVGQDPRDWQEIYNSQVSQDEDSLSAKDMVDKQRDAVMTTTAAYGARAFLDSYEQRRHLFHSQFRFQCDYSQDGKIGEPEFRAVVREKLQLSLSDGQLNALAERFFPKGSRRIEYDELLRLLAGNSNLPHNMKQLKDRR